MENQTTKKDYEIKEQSLENNSSTPTFSSFLSCTINLLKSTLGSGMLLLPYAFSKYGILLGFLVSLLAALLSACGLTFLVLSSNYAVQNGLCPPRKVSYGSLATITIGKWSTLVDLVLFVKCFLVGIQYLIVVRDNITGIIKFILPSLSEKSIFSTSEFQLLICLLGISYFCFQPKMDALKITSIFGLFGICYLFVLGIWMALTTNEETFFGKMNWFLPTESVNWKELFSLLSLFIFSYICHPSLLPIYNEVKDNSSPKMMKMVSLSIVGCFLNYLFFSILYYGIYGAGVESFVLKHFSLDSQKFTYEFLLARVFFILLMMFTYPLQAFPARVSLLKVIGVLCAKKDASSLHQEGGGGEEEEDSSNDLSITAVPGGKNGWIFYLVTFLMLLISYFCASITGDIKKLASVVGASTGPLICYVFPALFWIGLNRRSLSSQTNPMGILSYSLLFIGLIFIPTLLYFIFF